jgi:homoserine dehydrogenase
MPAESGQRETVRIDLALVGFGHVARRFVTLVDERAGRLARDHGLTTRIVGIATARHGAAFAPEGVDWRRALAIAEEGGRLDSLHDAAAGPVPGDGLALIERHGAAADPRIPRVVVETTVLDIARGQPAIDHVRAGFASGAHVITANKGPVAFAYRALCDAARAAGLTFLFEGAVMDGVPVFNLARRTLPAVTVQGFRGVLNSTTNHILTALEDGRPFEEALAEMQRAGVAEADPWLDVDGWDAAAKTAALANVLMDADLTPHEVDRTGIGPGSGREAIEAVAGGQRLRLVATAERRGAAVVARVRPVALPASDLLAGLRGQANALVLDTDLLGRVAITQLDGGLTQTAYALVSDLVEVRRRL